MVMLSHHSKVSTLRRSIFHLSTLLRFHCRWAKHINIVLKYWWVQIAEDCKFSCLHIYCILIHHKFSLRPAVRPAYMWIIFLTLPLSKLSSLHSSAIRYRIEFEDSKVTPETNASIPLYYDILWKDAIKLHKQTWTSQQQNSCIHFFWKKNLTYSSTFIATCFL